MFIEGRHDVKTPFYVHIDVVTKLIIGYALMNKTYGEVKRAIEFIKTIGRTTYAAMGRS